MINVHEGSDALFQQLVNDLVVDKDARINQNMIVQGDTSSGARGENVMS